MKAADRGTTTGMALEERLSLAVERGEISLVYQPIVRASDAEVIGVEALARLQIPELADVMPDVFLPMLFLAGQADAITEVTVRTALRDLDALSAHFGTSDLGLSINLSPPQLRNGRALVACIELELKRAGVKPGRITFEIVEDLAVPNRSLVAGTLATLRRLGVKLALDDFGTGRSSHEHLLDLHVDTIKIDQRFVSTVSSNDVARASTDALVGLGVALGLQVVAEGVRSEGDVAWLAEIGCHAVQGWAVGMPVAVDDGVATVAKPAPRGKQTLDARTDGRLTAIERQLLSGVRLSETEAEAVLDFLDADANHPVDGSDRSGWLRSWLVHVAGGGSAAVSDHVMNAKRSLRTGEFGHAGLEFSRAAVAACHSNQVMATLGNVTETCSLLVEDGWEAADRFRVLYNLSWIYADVTRTTEGIELHTRVFEAAIGHLPDHLTAASGFTAALLAIELLERGEAEPDHLASAHPERVLGLLREASKTVDPEDPLLWRWPADSLEIRWQLLDGASPEDIVPRGAKTPPGLEREPVAAAFWDCTESEYRAKGGDAAGAVSASRRAIDVFATSGFFKYRILHAWERQASILVAAGEYKGAALAQAEVLATLRQDNFDKNSQMMGAMLDFDLKATLAAELARTTAVFTACRAGGSRGEE